MLLLWILFGGVFFGGVHDFSALYASVKTRRCLRLSISKS
ncbi:MAG: hypothetical protein LBT14_05035 [Treponema sp.]|nr:hypothetical protein [Treponema sp.]